MWYISFPTAFDFLTLWYISFPTAFDFLTLMVDSWWQNLRQSCRDRQPLIVIKYHDIFENTAFSNERSGHSVNILQTSVKTWLSSGTSQSYSGLKSESSQVSSPGLWLLVDKRARGQSQRDSLWLNPSVKVSIHFSFVDYFLNYSMCELDGKTDTATSSSDYGGHWHTQPLHQWPLGKEAGLGNSMGKQWKQWLTLFWGGFKITADGGCSHEIKRCLLLGRKIMTNLDSILKTRDITLPTKVRLVKAMVFPVVMYGCESWAMKKTESRRTDVFELWWWRRLLRVPWTARRSHQSILKEISPQYSLEGLMLKLKLQYFGHLMWRADSFEKTLILGKIEGGKRSRWQRMRWLDGILLDGHKFE